MTKTTPDTPPETVYHERDRTAFCVGDTVVANGGLFIAAGARGNQGTVSIDENTRGKVIRGPHPIKGKLGQLFWGFTIKFRSGETVDLGPVDLELYIPPPLEQLASVMEDE